MENIQIDVNDVLGRMTAELAAATQRAVIAEAGNVARDKVIADQLARIERMARNHAEEMDNVKAKTDGMVDGEALPQKAKPEINVSAGESTEVAVQKEIRGRRTTAGPGRFA